MNPPARSAPTTFGAIGIATARIASQAATIHHRRRTANRPRLAKSPSGADPTRGSEGDAIGPML